MTKQSSSTQLAIDLLSGTAGGVSQICIGHPFDTLKVALQRTTKGDASTSLVFQNIIKKQGIAGLYAGIGPPLITVAIFNALLFTTTGYLNRVMRPEGGSHELTPLQQAMTGALAGIPVSLLATPTELLKCRLQAQGRVSVPKNAAYTLADAHAGKVLYKGTIDALKKIVQYEGGPQALFKGLIPTLVREIPGNACYFGCYALTKQELVKTHDLPNQSQLGVVDLIMAGGIAGAAFWLPSIPIDVIKTRIQTDSAFSPKYKGMMDCARQIVQKEGWSALYKGWQPCLARSIPANSALFLTYEAVHSSLQSMNVKLQ